MAANGYRGFNIQGLTARIEAWGDAVEREAQSALEGVAAEAAEGVREIIHTAVTATGEARAASGRGVAGRIESEDMLNAVDHSVTEEGDETVAKWGWENAEDYFLIQEYGSEEFNTNIAGMDALGQTFAKATDKFEAELGDIVRRSM